MWESGIFHPGEHRPQRLCPQRNSEFFSFYGFFYKIINDFTFEIVLTFTFNNYNCTKSIFGKISKTEIECNFNFISR